MHCQVYFEITEDSKLDAACLLKKLEEHGVLVMSESSRRYASLSSRTPFESTTYLMIDSHSFSILQFGCLGNHGSYPCLNQK